MDHFFSYSNKIHDIPGLLKVIEFLEDTIISLLFFFSQF